MKDIIIAALLAVLLGGAAIGRAEEPPIQAVLSFSSFDGGGPEYEIVLDDPTIAEWDSRREYDRPDHDQLTGAAYTEIFTFTGLKPGETALTVSARSPIAENFDARYTLCVDGTLNATLIRDQAIAGFYLRRSGEIARDVYRIITLQGEYRVSVNDGPYRRIDPSVADALYAVVAERDLFRWDGFDRSRKGVLDGEGFELEIDMTDGVSIRARGSNAFPEGYFDAIEELQAILDGIPAEPTLTMGGLTGLFSGLAPNKREMIVGTDIAFADITDFFYTYDASTNPPEYQRYRFYVEDGATFFYHETREGDGWPLTEADITVSGTAALTEEALARFHGLLEGGIVRRREESLDSGDAGPWLFIYWNGDGDEYQAFSFASPEARSKFEAFCAALRDAAE